LSRAVLYKAKSITSDDNRIKKMLTKNNCHHINLSINFIIYNKNLTNLLTRSLILCIMINNNFNAAKQSSFFYFISIFCSQINKITSMNNFYEINSLTDIKLNHNFLLLMWCCEYNYWLAKNWVEHIKSLSIEQYWLDCVQLSWDFISWFHRCLRCVADNLY
jgi:hypothetical protein